MTRVLVTGSADGLGRLAAVSLLDDGHEVVVHVRGEERRTAVDDLVERGAAVVVGDLADDDQTQDVADQVRRSGPVDAVIHNAGVNSGPGVLAVNVVAPYLLSALLPEPRRLVYLSSGMHLGGRARLPSLARGAGTSYSDSKLLLTTLAMAVARRRPDVLSNAVDPGWVPTRMGGRGAPDDLTLGHRTQEWLAVSDDPEARTTGGYWYHQARRRTHEACQDTSLQEDLLAELARHTGVPLS